MIPALEKLRGPIAELCARHGVARLHAFGSSVSGDFRAEESDIDLLVEFAPMEPYARVDAYFGLLEDLRVLFDARVDLVMTGAIKNRFIARDIERTKQELYAA